MMGWIVLAIIVAIECGMMGYSILQKKNIKIERAVIRISVFGVAVLAVITGIIMWNFSVIGMYFVLFLLAIYSAVILIKHARRRLKVKDYKAGRTIHHTFQMIVLLGFSVLPMLLFPGYKPLETTGQYKSKMVNYTWTDKSRQETLSEIPEARNVTVAFYYPAQYKDGTELEANETFPLIVFSHGSFGIIDSNSSLFEELASNGYVVCSISHTYQAFYTEETNGNIKLANMDFIQEAFNATNGLYDMAQEKKLEAKWMELRTGDMNFVLDTIDQKVKEHSDDAAFKRININHIGLIGHSLGGATAVQTARERANIDAVVVLDGTHVGEKMAIKNGEWVYNETPLDVPVLDMRAEDHSKSIEQSSQEHVNDHTLRIAEASKAVTILGTKHMNFTDLPMFSPFLANKLGVGTCNATECTKQIDSIVLQWFNYYIKGNSALEIHDVYEIN
ncbi:MAG: dienelactone hydrolase family protein [bacterium]|nr:dienelactone hydrolase family protein [bacterium]